MPLTQIALNRTHAPLVRTLLAALLLAFTFAAAKPTASEVQDLAAEAYLYGLQQVIFFGQRWTYTQNNDPGNINYAGKNRFVFIREKITPDFPVVTPNSTTLYGNGILDLTDGPMVIDMPAIDDRYFSLQIMDQYGIFWLMAGNQFNGRAARSYLLLPVGYDGPLPGQFPTTDVIQATSNVGYLFARIAVVTGTKEDIATINGYQDEIMLTPLEEWVANGNQGNPLAQQAVIGGDYAEYAGMSGIARGQVDAQDAEDFFSILHLVLNDPAMVRLEDSIKEQAFLSRLAEVGIGAGLDFSWDALDSATRDALETGFKDGFDNVRQTLQTSLINMNGWMEVRNAGGFETGWLDRAVMADAGWAGPDKNVSHTGAFRFDDADGQALNGANRYTLTFDLDDLPPVTEFWSIPIYNSDGYFVPNEIGRYTVNSFMLENDEFHTEDGQVVFYVQTERPSDPKRAKNWLPAPPDGFRFTARFYGPTMAIIDGSYDMPAPVRVR